MQHQLMRSRDVWREDVGTRWTFLKTDSLQVQLDARLLIYIYSDDLRTTKVGAAAPGELPGELDGTIRPRPKQGTHL